MSQIRVLIVRLASFFRGRRLNEELEEELSAHLEMAAEEHRRRGIPDAEARRMALREFGGVTQTREQYRMQRGLPFLESIWRDAGYGCRQLRRNPGFALIAALSLALAIGANTTIFSVARQLLYARLDVPQPTQLRLLRWNGDSRLVLHGMWGAFDPTPQGGMTGSIFSYPVFEQLQAHNRVMQSLFAFKEDSMNAVIQGSAQRMDVAMVSGNFYAGLEVQPQLGRGIEASDNAVPGAGAVAVISNSLWSRQFSRSRSVVGRTIRVNGVVLTIIGVNPKGFTGAKSVQISPDVFVPLTMQPLIDPKGEHGNLLNDTKLSWLNVMGRLRPGVSASQAQSALSVDLDAAIRNTMMVSAGDTLPRLVLAAGDRGLHTADSIFKKPVYVLLTLTGFVLLLACANVATLLLARAAQRQREMSVRLALGAGRMRILRQLLTESLLLAVAGGFGGLLVSYLARNAVPELMLGPWERTELTIPFDWGVFAFCAAVTILTGILFGFAPAWLAARAEVSSSLKESAQSATRRRRHLGGKAIVAFQIALSTLLVAGAGLFLRTVVALNAVHVGFNPNHLILFGIQPPPARYPGNEAIRLHEELEQRIAALPGIESVSTALTPYIANNMDNSDFVTAHKGGQQSGHDAEFFNIVGTEFFQTLEIPIVEGRGFGPQDTATSRKVAVINQALAQKRFPGMNPIGQWFKSDPAHGSPWIQIVGICANTHYASLLRQPPAQFFLPLTQQADAGGMTYEVRTRVSPEALAGTLHRLVQSVDPDLPIVDLRTQRQQISATFQVQRALGALAAAFGLLALILACVGIYGVMAYSVVQRKNEMGIRLALGAHPARVRNMVLRESAWIAGAGIAGGLVLALCLARLVGSLLYGIGPYDPVTIVGTAALLLVVAFVASALPARWAARIQPMEAIRHE